MLEFVLNISTNVFCQYCPRREGLGRGGSVKLPGRRPPPFSTGRGQLNDRVTFSELTVLLYVFGECMGGWE